jgi:hypothetical protein
MRVVSPSALCAEPTRQSHIPLDAPAGVLQRTNHKATHRLATRSIQAGRIRMRISSSQVGDLPKSPMASASATSCATSKTRRRSSIASSRAPSSLRFARLSSNPAKITAVAASTSPMIVVIVPTSRKSRPLTTVALRPRMTAVTDRQMGQSSRRDRTKPQPSLA